MKVDFHDLTVAEATKLMLEIIDKIRLSSGTETFELITGQGKIQKELLTILKEYQCFAKIDIGNSGIIITEIE